MSVAVFSAGVSSLWHDRPHILRRSLMLGLATGTILCPLIAHGQTLPGFYVSGAAGPNIAGSIVSQSQKTDIHTDVGPVGVLAIGYAFSNGFRTEIEGDYRSNDVSGILTRRIDGRLLPMSAVGGASSAYGFMANARYELPLDGLKLPFRPYVGGGIGYSRLDFDNVTGTEPFLFSTLGGGTFRGVGVRTMGTAGAFAYQAIAGGSLPIASIPGLEATAEYRYFGTTYGVVPINTHSTIPLPVIVKASIPSYSKVMAGDNAVMFGLRYALVHPAS